jgi:hypothetical protein
MNDESRRSSAAICGVKAQSSVLVSIVPFEAKSSKVFKHDNGKCPYLIG